MNRTILMIAGVFGASSLLLIDSAVKGTALLILAAVTAIILRRDSAATRHLIWLLALIAMLAVPVLSAMLPQWRVLPEWAGIAPKPVVAAASPPSMARPEAEAVEMSWNTQPGEVGSPSASAHQPAAALPDSHPVLATPQAIGAPAVRGWNWRNALPLAWAIGFCVLILRLMAARWMLWNAERQGTVIWPSRQSATIHDPMVMALQAACLQLGIRRPVTLLIHPDKTIPVVWGILRCRLLLPAAARQWSGEQLRSVLLHELAHIKRRDTIAQLLAQLACALHWFNPLVWLAAWRLGVERERACDDLVLASGVRPSAYAGHLLEVVTEFSSARWTQSCGLAMARKSSLEGRLAAVLSKSCNRRGVTTALAAAVLLLGAGIAVPLAMLRAAEEKPGQEPKAVTADTKPKGSEKIDSAVEGRLRWGNAVKGLRAAIAVRPAPAKSTPSDVPELYLAVQNVSDAPIRLSDTTAAPDLREVYLKIDGRTESAHGSKDPTGTDVMLQPREVVFLLMFASDGKSEGGHTLGSIFAEEVLKDTHETIVGELQIKNAPAGAWTGKLVTGETSGEAAAGKPQPKDGHAQALFKIWQANARTDGKIPGALVGQLGETVKLFISISNSKWGNPLSRDLSLKFEKLLPRFDVSRDWTQSGAIALLDDISAIGSNPLKATVEAAEYNVIRSGKPLPAELADAPWGQPSPNGLRVARLLEPRAKEYPLGISLKSRILAHNSGKKTAIFIMPSWQEFAGHTAHDAKGAAIEIKGTTPEMSGTTSVSKMTYRLAPGEYCEAPAVSIGVGAQKDENVVNWHVASWIDAKPGDEVSFSPGAVEVRCSPFMPGASLPSVRPFTVDIKDAADLWKKIIAERVERELPLPAAAAERVPIIRRVTLDLFGATPTPEEVAAFVADDAPTAVANLEKRLAGRPGMAPFTGTLPPGDIQFRVLAPDPDAAKKPRATIGIKASEVLENLKKYDAIYESGFSASGTEMGRDLLGLRSGASLDVTRRWKLTCDDNRFGYTADVTDHEKTPGRKSIRTKRWGYWGQDLSGHYFEDTLFDANPEGKETELGKDLHTSLYGPRDVRINSSKYVFLYGLGRFFSKDLAKITRVEETKDGLLVVSALGTSSRITMVPFSSGRWELEIEPAAAWIVRKARFYSDAEPQSTWAGVWTEMTSSGTVWSGPYCIPKEATINSQGPIAKKSGTKRLTFDPVVGKFDEKLYGTVRQAVGDNKEPTLKVFDNRVSPETVTEPNRPRPAAPAVNAEPKDGKSRALFENWKSSARSDGKIPGGRIGEMAADLKTFMELNPGHEQSVKLEPVVKKCDASRDWTPAEAAALLDEIAAITRQAEWAMRTNTERMIRPGKPLPDELANAPWGKPAENGLRIAWLLEPRAETQALDSVMKSRVLFHNTGKAPVCFATENWIQTGGHKAKDASGKDIGVWAISRMGIRLRMNFRLAPGEYAEVEGHGLGVGPHETSTEKSILNVGCWIEAKEGDAVTFTPASVLVSFQTWQNNEGRKDSVTVWREMIAARVMQESPMPAAAADREQLLRRVTKDLLGAAPTAEEIAAFVADNAPDALARLIKSLQARAAAMHFAGELSGGETKFRVTAAEAREKPKPGADAGAQPKHEYAQALFKKWQALARTDGKIPGALIGEVGAQVDGFLKQHPAGDQSSKLAALRPRLDASRDWTQADAVALLNDITAISTAPVSWAELSLTFGGMGNLQAGRPLPAELATAAWGAPAANGLRAAWLLEPRADQYPLGSVLKARVLFHNSGQAPVVFGTETWHQGDPHTARDAKGGEVKVSSTWYSGITPTAMYRLAPGEYCEVMGHGIAIGAGEYTEEHSTGSVGAVIEAKAGDEVRLSHSVDATYGGWTRPNDPKDPAELWKKGIAERVARQAPMPQAAADREQLIRRVTLDLFGVAATAEEIAAFVGDNTPGALAAFTACLQAKPRVEPWGGKLATGETKFRVVAAAPDAAKAPRTAKAPGRYVLGDNVHLLVSQTTTGEQRTNKAVLAFLSPDPKVASPHKPCEIALPDGIDTYGIVWERGAGALWILQKDLVRSYDFTKPDAVKETRFEQGGILNVPARLREAMKQAFDVPDAPRQQQEPPKGAKLEIPAEQPVKRIALAGQPDTAAQQPQSGARLKPATEQKLKWGEPANGLRMALAWPPSLGEPGIGEAPMFHLVVQNVSQAAIRLVANEAAPNPRRLMLRNNGAPISAIRDPSLVPGDWLLQPGQVAFLRMFQTEKLNDTLTFSAAEEQTVRIYPQYSVTAEMSIEKAPAGAWTGKLATAETRGSVDVIPAKHKDAQALYKSWTTAARADGKLPGALIGLLGESVKTFIKGNPTWATTPQLQKMLPRFDASRDWNGQDAVGLLDELTAVQDTPIGMALDHEKQGIIRTGTPLPPELADAPWGSALPNGLRHAWLLEPRATEHRLGTPLKARVLIHNAGQEPLVFRTRSWHQLEHKATDAKGAAITVESTMRNDRYQVTRGQLTPFRLEPGEFTEVNASGIGVGPVGKQDNWQNVNVGSWVQAKAGDEVTVTTGPLPLSDWNETPELLDGVPRWWIDHIKARLSRHLPFPDDAEARLRLLHCVAIEVLGTSASKEMNDAFVADTTPAALDSVAKRLAHFAGLTPYTG